MADENIYTELIAGAHREKPKFTEWLYTLTEPLNRAREQLAAFREDYDLDLAAGAQLDAVGVRVGFSRKLKIRITDAFFAFNDVDGVGLDLGVWFEPKMSSYGFSELPDDVYRTCLRAKIALNHYNGTNEGLAGFLNAFRNAFSLTSDQFNYIDGQDMSIVVQVARNKVPPVVWQIFESGDLPINHAGVLLNLLPTVQSYLATTEAVPLVDDSERYLTLEVS